MQHHSEIYVSESFSIILSMQLPRTVAHKYNPITPLMGTLMLYPKDTCGDDQIILVNMLNSSSY